MNPVSLCCLSESRQADTLGFIPSSVRVRSFGFGSVFQFSGSPFCKYAEETYTSGFLSPAYYTCCLAVICTVLEIHPARPRERICSRGRCTIRKTKVPLKHQTSRFQQTAEVLDRFDISLQQPPEEGMGHIVRDRSKGFARREMFRQAFHRHSSAKANLSRSRG
ncbi:hypothetical protein BKA81DRAFT_356463 [Phyllosticta paracitricarpa]